MDKKFIEALKLGEAWRLENGYSECRNRFRSEDYEGNLNVAKNGCLVWNAVAATAGVPRAIQVWMLTTNEPRSFARTLNEAGYPCSEDDVVDATLLYDSPSDRPGRYRYTFDEVIALLEAQVKTDE